MFSICVPMLEPQMWMAVLWNNFIIQKSFHIRHVSAVFQEFHVAKDEFCPKIVNTLQISYVSRPKPNLMPR